MPANRGRASTTSSSSYSSSNTSHTVSTTSGGETSSSTTTNGGFFSNLWGKIKSGISSIFGSGKYSLGYGKQIDPSIANIQYNAPGDTVYQTIGNSACGPAAAVSAVNYAYGRGSEDVLNAANYAISNGYKERNGGTMPEFFTDYFSQNGLNSELTYNKSRLKERILSGQPTVLMGTDPNGVNSSNPFGENPHYVTATGTDSHGNVIIQDPESNYDNQLYNINDVISKSSLGVSAFGKYKRHKYGMYKYGTGLRGSCINEQCYNFFIDNGFSAAAAAGAVGNLMAEAGVDSSGQINASAIESNGEGVGIVQWSFGRKTAFLEFCKAAGDPFPNKNIELQLRFIKKELDAGNQWLTSANYGSQYKMSYQQFLKLTDPSIAAGAWCAGYERPNVQYAHLDNRIKYAVDIYNKYSGNTAVAYSPSAVTTTSTGVSNQQSGTPGLIDKLKDTNIGKSLSAFTGLITGTDSNAVASESKYGMGKYNISKLKSGRAKNNNIKPIIKRNKQTPKSISSKINRGGRSKIRFGRGPEFTKYNLSESQLKKIANLCYQEQGTVKGAAAEASLMCNLFEKQGSRFGSGADGLYNYVRNSGWFAHAARFMDGGTSSNEIVEAVRNVIVNGYRTLPVYVDNHDCFSDIRSVSNNGSSFTVSDRSSYQKDVTVIKSVYGATSTFYSFPDTNSDPFSYTSKTGSDECYSIDGTLNGSSGNTATTNTTADSGLVSKIISDTKIGKALSSFSQLFTGSSSSDSSSTSDSSSSSSSVASGPVAERAAAQMDAWANDDSHGYSQANRWGPDYDCSSAVISAYEAAGVPLKSNGATYTGDMKNVALKLGFKDITNSVNLDTGENMQRGDILLNQAEHAAMYDGNGNMVHARSSMGNSNPGDASGDEFRINPYHNHPWDTILRYQGGTGNNKNKPMSKLGMATNPFNKKTQYQNYMAYNKMIKQQGMSEDKKVQYSVSRFDDYGRAKNPIRSNNQSTNNTVVSAPTINYTSLIKVVIETLVSIADNTDKLNIIVSLLKLMKYQIQLLIKNH